MMAWLARHIRIDPRRYGPAMTPDYRPSLVRSSERHTAGRRLPEPIAAANATVAVVAARRCRPDAG
jgi:hypothetical protein